jgi:hypothetical protein
MIFYARTGRPGARLAGALIAGIGAVALAACGSSVASGGAAPHRSASTFISQMKSAVRGASSMHMTGHLSNEGKPIGLNLGVLRAGGLNGSITQSGVPLHLIGTRRSVYVKATPAFLHELHAGAAVCSLMCGKYVQLSGAQADQLTGSLSMASLTRSLTTGLPSFRQTGSTTVNGQPAVELRGNDGSTLDLAARGKPYPLRVVAPRGRRAAVTFSQWSRVPAPSAPPAGQVINLSKLKAGTG